MARRKRFRKLSWFEPVRLQRPPAIRIFKMLYPQVLRAVAWGVVAAAALHALVAVFAPAALQWIPLVTYYAGAAFLVPTMLAIVFVVLAVIPRHITLQRKRLVVVHGQSATAYEGCDLHSWRFITLPSSPADMLIRLKFVEKKGRRRRLTLGLSRKIDVNDVDRALRRMVRLTRRLRTDECCGACF